MSKHTDGNVSGENSRAETNFNEKHVAMARAPLQRNPVLISTGGAATSSVAGNNSTIVSRTRRQSSHNSAIQQILDRKYIRYENTYRMEPDPDHRINMLRINQVVTTIIDAAVTNYTYDANQARQLTLTLADRLRAQIKSLVYPRYRVIVQVCIGQKKGQDVRVISRALWEPKWDRHITINKETSNAYVNVTIFCVYTE